MLINQSTKANGEKSTMKSDGMNNGEIDWSR
jgi:hypothetical protein